MTPEGVRIELRGARDHERTQVGDEEAVLRESAHEALRAAGLLEAGSAGSRSGPATLPGHLEMTQRARKRNRRSRGSVRRKILVGLRRSCFAAVAVAVGGVAAYAVSIWDKTPALGTLKPIEEGATSVVFAADGSRLGYIQSDTIRHPVDEQEDPERPQARDGGDRGPELLRARRRRLHLRSSGRRSPTSRRARRSQGGSTITQQLVRNLYIAHPQEDIERKIEEAKLATEYEDKYSKNQILTKYLNTASYGTTNGRTAVGVQAAAETYFDTGVSHLDLPQAAMIAGLPQAPSEYNPFLNPKAALAAAQRGSAARWQQQGYISPADYDAGLPGGAWPSPGPQVRDHPRALLLRLRPAAADRQVRGQHGPQRRAQGLHDDQPAASGGRPARGRRVRRLLLGRRPAVGARLDRRDQRPHPGDGLLAALLADLQFNFAADAHRQPGSSFKPYVLATAISQGMDPDTTYYSGASPMTLTLPDGTTWTVNNSERAGGRDVECRRGDGESVNVVFAQLDLDVGPENVRKTAYEMGITTHLDGIPAEGIGGLRLGVTPLEQADGYATLADGGVHHTATAIGKVVFPNGDTDTPGEASTSRVFSDGVAYAVTDVLKGVITSGHRGRLHGHRLPGGRQDGHDRGRVGRVVRRLHAANLDRRLGRPPRSRDATGFGGPTAGADLARPIWRLPAGATAATSRRRRTRSSTRARGAGPTPSPRRAPRVRRAAPAPRRRPVAARRPASTRPRITRPVPARAPRQRLRQGGGGAGNGGSGGSP